MTTDAVTPLEEPAAMTATTPRAFPLPPWASEPRYPTGAEVWAWLLDLAHDGRGLDPVGEEQAVAYLDDKQRRHYEAQNAASRCAVEGHDTARDELVGTLDALRTTRVNLAEAIGRVGQLERDLAGQGQAYRALEELYVATHRPPVQLVTELDEGDDRYEVVTVTLAYDLAGLDVEGLDRDARRRIAEATAIRAHQAYEAERNVAAATPARRLDVDQARDDQAAAEAGGVADRGRC